VVWRHTPPTGSQMLPSGQHCWQAAGKPPGSVNGWVATQGVVPLGQEETCSQVPGMVKLPLPTRSQNAGPSLQHAKGANGGSP
jgi:hypothetical protein